MTDFEKQLSEDQALIELALSKQFQGQTPRADLYDAMQYSLLAGGKRIRPVFVLEVCRMCGGDIAVALPLACAVEMVHTYSLIHDDLPCMDDDDLRRGKATNHKVFGEATAVLAGDALLTAAFECICEAEADLSCQQRLTAIACLGKAAGARGMVGGQCLDLAAEGRSVNRSDIEELQALKTGALLSAAAELGCIAAQASQESRDATILFAQKIGMAFQICDDILDVVSNETQLGKSVGSDVAHEKATFVSLLGLEACYEKVNTLTEQGVQAIAEFEEGGFLTWLAKKLAGREW